MFFDSKCDRPIDWRRSRGPTRPLGTPPEPRKCRGRTPGGRPGQAGSGTIFEAKPKNFQKILGGPKTLFKGFQTCWGPQNRHMSHFGPPPKGAIWAQNAHGGAQNGSKNGPKTGFFHEIFFCSKTLREGSWVVPGPPTPNFDLFWGAQEVSIGPKILTERL